MVEVDEGKGSEESQCDLEKGNQRKVDDLIRSFSNT
jgi:hypothetical protein